MEMISGSASYEILFTFRRKPLFRGNFIHHDIFCLYFLRYDPAGAHIKKELLKQHIPYKLTVFVGQTALAAY